MSKKLILLLIVFGVIVGFSSVASALPLIGAVDRSGGASDDRPQIGVYTGETDPVPTQAGGWTNGNYCFSDREYTWVNTPAEIDGAEQICTFNTDKENLATVTYTVEFPIGATVLITVDDRFGDQQGYVDSIVTNFATPGTFTDTGWGVFVSGDDDRPLSVFSAAVDPGTYVFVGANEGGNNFYVIGALDSPIPPGAARSPDPPHLAIDVPVDANLCWTPGAGALFHRIYFSDDPCNLVLVATQALGDDCYNSPVDFIASTTYYWEIVEVNGIDTIPSGVWEFTTIPGEAQPDYPYDGAIISGDTVEYLGDDYIWTKLIFFPGPTAASHTGYFHEDYSKVESRHPDAFLGSPPYAEIQGWEYTFFAGNPQVPPANFTLVRGTKYYWTVDANDGLGNTFAGDVWEFAIQGLKAFEPSPPNEAIFIGVTPFLSWLPGFGVVEHDIYMGTNREDVSNARYDFYNPPPEFVATRSDPNYQVKDINTLPYSTKIYWRVDQVNGRMPPPMGGGEYFFGDIWEFETEPYFPITDPNLLVWWKFDMGFENIAWDSSGHKRHGVISGATWTNPGGGGSASCLEFGGDGDMVEDADGEDYLNGLSAITMALWIKSREIGTDSGFIILETPDDGDSMDIRYDSDGGEGDLNLLKYGLTYTGGDEQDESPANLQTTDWQHVAVTSASGAGLKLYINGVQYLAAEDDANATGTITGCTTLIVGKGGKDEGADAGWDGLIDDVQIYDYALSAEEIIKIATPPEAWNPRPYKGEIGVVSPVTLRWNPGKYADKHNVYYSTDKALVDSRNIAAYQGQRDPNNYGPIMLDTGKVYYWAIDEVNLAGPDPCIWAGETWLFRAEGAAGGLLGLYYHWDGILPPQGSLPYEPGPLNPFQIFVLSRIDPSVNFNWGDFSPDPNINVDDFASRWVGHVECPMDANYTFYTTTDDGARLFIDGQQLQLIEAANPTHDSWQQGGMGAADQWRASIDLSAGVHDIEMHQYERAGGAGAELRWSAIPTNPSDDAISMQIIPPIWLWPPLFASGPRPPDGATVDDRMPMLEWIPGVNADYHELYFSANFNDVNDRTPGIKQTLTDPCRPYPAVPPLQLATTYYWLVDEVKNSPPGRWNARTVWSFTISECLSLDNMEDYNDRGELRGVWRDGNADVVWGGTYPYLTLVQGGSSGSNLNVSTEVGSPTGAAGPIPPTPLNYEAMVLYYDNDGWTYQALPGEEKWVYDVPYYSEIEANTVGDNSLGVGQTWDSEGVKSLSLSFQGHPVSDGYYEAPLWPAYTVYGRGRDIQGRHDEFYFLSQYPFIGAGSIQARVFSVDNTDPWAKAGVMIREKRTPYSKYAAVFITPGQGVTFQYRDSEDGPTTTITKPGVSAPQYVRLVRNISGAFEAKHSDNIFVWQDVNAPDTEPMLPEIAMGTIDDPNIYVGTAVTSHNANQICAADFNDLLISPLPSNWIYGNIGTNDPEQLYVALSDGTNTSVVEHDDPNAATLTSWQEWNIELSDFTTVNLDAIKKVYIGFGDRAAPAYGGSGAIYVDDIRACPPRCVPAFAQMIGDIAQPYDCTIDEKDISVLAGDWLLMDDFITSVAPIASNLIMHWAFDEGLGAVAGDSSAGTTNGAVVGPDWTSPGSNGSGYCLNFDGLGDYVQVPDGNDANNILNGLAAISVSVWVKSDVTGTDKGIIICEVPNGSDNVITMRYDADGSSYGGTNLIKMGITTTGGLVQLESSSGVQTTDWQHLVMTWSSGQDIRFYIDGLEDTPAGRDPNTVGAISDVVALIVGKGGKDTAPNQSWDGLIDDVRIYNYVLPEEEIAYLATDGGAGIHIPINSPADLYKGEAQGNQWINFKDYSLIADQYLEKLLWPTP